MKEWAMANPGEAMLLAIIAMGVVAGMWSGLMRTIRERRR